MAKVNPRTEYELVQAQILERKLELRRSGFPEQMYDLWSVLRMYPGWAANGFETPLHPMAANLRVSSTALVSFTFNEKSYDLQFLANSSHDDRVFGKLTIKTEREELMSSSFVADRDEYGTGKFGYSDSSAFKKGPWVEDLAKFQRENAEIRAEAKRRNWEGPENLAALRAQFGIPPPLPKPHPESTFWRRLFSR